MHGGHGLPRTRPATDSSEAPKSAARLAAEAVFALPERELSPADAPQVVVRKARVVAAAAPMPMPIPMPQSPASAPPKAEVPRVFRVDTPIDAQAALARARFAQPAGAVPAAAVDAPAFERIARNKRIAVDKRPGPMVQLFQAPPTARSEALVAPESAAEPQFQAQELLAQLAQLEPVFESIRHAQSLRLVDDQSARAWQRLSLQAETIRKQIDDALRR